MVHIALFVLYKEIFRNNILQQRSYDIISFYRIDIFHNFTGAALHNSILGGYVEFQNRFLPYTFLADDQDERVAGPLGVVQLLAQRKLQSGGEVLVSSDDYKFLRIIMIY